MNCRSLQWTSPFSFGSNRANMITVFTSEVGEVIKYYRYAQRAIYKEALTMFFNTIERSPNNMQGILCNNMAVISKCLLPEPKMKYFFTYCAFFSEICVYLLIKKCNHLIPSAMLNAAVSLNNKLSWNTRTEFGMYYLYAGILKINNFEALPYGELQNLARMLLSRIFYI